MVITESEEPLLFESESRRELSEPLEDPAQLGVIEDRKSPIQFRDVVLCIRYESGEDGNWPGARSSVIAINDRFVRILLRG